jgi:hypothetical protein
VDGDPGRHRGDGARHRQCSASPAISSVGRSSDLEMADETPAVDDFCGLSYPKRHRGAG